MTTVGIATGAGRGTGEACARRLADMVDVLLLADRNEAAAAAVAKDLAGRGVRAVVEPFEADVTDGEGLARLAGRAGELGTLRAVAHADGVEAGRPAGAGSSRSTSSERRWSPRRSVRWPPPVRRSCTAPRCPR